MEGILEVVSIANAIENLLKIEGLSFRRIKKKETIIFRNIKIGNDFSIEIAPFLVSLEILLTDQKDIKNMQKLLNKFIKKYENLDFSILEKDSSINFRLLIHPFKISIFKEIFFDLSFEFQEDVSPFVLGVVTEKPEEFLLNQYKIWKSIPDEEKSRVIEQILTMKESYFRSVKTQSGIIKKLNQIKKGIASNFGKDIEYTPKETDQNLTEFYLLDFAATLRAIELGLIKLKLCDLFEDFKLRRGK
jgi:hypothetical protein